MVDLDVDCSRLSKLISVEEIIRINIMITEPEAVHESGEWEAGESIANHGVESEGLETNRAEDYHQVRDIGRIETLVETMLPYECKENNDVVWLTSLIMSEIAQNQAFGEGNKRTAYMAGIFFLVRTQLLEKEKAAYPRLDRDLTDKLSELAVDGTDQENTLTQEEFYNYLEKRLP